MKRSMKITSGASLRLHLPWFVSSSFMKPFFMNHTTIIQVNIAPNGMSILAVT